MVYTPEFREISPEMAKQADKVRRNYTPGPATISLHGGIKPRLILPSDAPKPNQIPFGTSSGGPTAAVESHKQKFITNSVQRGENAILIDRICNDLKTNGPSTRHQISDRIGISDQNKLRNIIKAARLKRRIIYTHISPSYGITESGRKTSNHRKTRIAEIRIRLMRTETMSLKDISDMFNISNTDANDLIRGMVNRKKVVKISDALDIYHLPGQKIVQESLVPAVEECGSTW